ncbi:MAG: FadR/GntR family transcriptional regulator [Bryobacteraceae bacterium]|nr:FadR/GntR family transcriptional regulator [Bryobacteraceae bacterium]
MLPGLKPAARLSLSGNITEQITALIARGVWKPGDRIPGEHQLCQQFGVGRTSVREALRQLAVMGMVESHAGDGTFVSAGLQDLVETRLMLEASTAALAAVKATDEDLREIADAIAGMKASLDDPEAYLTHDLRFHMALGAATRNPMVRNLLATTRGYLQAWIKKTLQESGRAQLSIAEHRRILKALKARNPERARKAMEAHIVSSSRDLG